MVQSNGSNGFGVTKTSSSLAARLTCFFRRWFVTGCSLNRGNKGGLINGSCNLGEVGTDDVAKRIRLNSGCNPAGNIALRTSGLDREFEPRFPAFESEFVFELESEPRLLLDAELELEFDRELDRESELELEFELEFEFEFEPELELEFEFEFELELEFVFDREFEFEFELEFEFEFEPELELEFELEFEFEFELEFEFEFEFELELFDRWLFDPLLESC